jgi:DNA repair protein RecN (Recombination protein N)
MLTSLFAKNYLLIDELKVGFQPGLNIITGETGAGKSILIGALGALLGERLGKEVIRGSAEKSVIEGEFSVAGVPAAAEFLRDKEIEEQGESILVRREVHVGGKSRCFINDTPVPLAVLAELGDLLVDLHGQHEHQLLLKVANHGPYLDAFAGLEPDLEALKVAYQQLLSATRELRTAEERAGELARSRDYMAFQLQEIQSVAPTAGEEEQLQHEEQILKNAELLFERTSQIFARLYESEGSAAELLNATANDLNQLAAIDSRFAAMQNDCQSALILIDELAKSVQHYNQAISFDPERLEKIRQRLSALTALRRKHGGTLEEVIALGEKLAGELGLIDNLAATLEELTRARDSARSALAEMNSAISGKRQAAAQIFSDKVAGALANLGMPRARFAVRQYALPSEEEPFVPLAGQKVRIGARGSDHLEFMLSANPGEEARPLAAVASGGEISRVMLALKTLLAEADRIPVLIFDEIDIGISGRIAQAVGRSLKELATSHQVLCITHLPQIASMADHHLLVEKGGDEKETRTTIRPLSEQERVAQVAALIGGEVVTQAHLQSASELIAAAGMGA